MSYSCPVAVAQDSSEDEYQPETAVESHLLLLKQKKYCDVTFTFPHLPDRIAAHEIYLKARSPVFAKIFRMQKSGNVQDAEIEISESTPEIFHKFLEFIYADKLEVGVPGALELLQLAQKYKVRLLTKKCEELLTTEIPIVDSVKVFQTARRYGRRQLMDRAGQIMVRTFGMLMKLGAFTTAEDEALAYLLDSDDLSVKEVELFEMILNWGKKQVEATADGGPLKNKLKNLISKIRYTNMAPDEFTKVVVPTGLLSAEEIISVYPYFCGDDIKRRDLKTKFNTRRRKTGNIKTVSESVFFSQCFLLGSIGFPAFSKHSTNFIADRARVYGKIQPDHTLRRTVITAINFYWPLLNSKYRGKHVLNFNVSIAEYLGPAKEGNFTLRFEKKLLDRGQDKYDEVSVEPPVELVSGRAYSVLVEDHSTLNSIDSFCIDPEAYRVRRFPNMNREANIDLEDVRLTLRDIQTKTDLYAQNLPDRSEKFATITYIKVRLI